MAKLPPPRRTLTGEIRKGREQTRRALNSSPFFNTGLSIPAPGVVQADGELDVNGTLNVGGQAYVTGPLTVGGAAAFSGNTNIGGNLVVTGTLSLPAGIIDNAALANPTAFGFGGNSSIGFAISTSAVAKTAITIPIPSGFTRALVHCTANGTAQNTTASLDFLYVSASIALPSGGGGVGGEAFAGTPAGGWSNASASAGGSYSSIGTGSITVSCLMSTSGASWSSTGSNIANVDATVTFLR